MKMYVIDNKKEKSNMQSLIKMVHQKIKNSLQKNRIRKLSLKK